VLKLLTIIQFSWSALLTRRVIDYLKDHSQAIDDPSMASVVYGAFNSIAYKMDPAYAQEMSRALNARSNPGPTWIRANEILFSGLDIRSQMIEEFKP
jgi:hypothetical protein